MENTETLQIKVLINLSSLLLCEGLQSLLQNEPSTYHAIVAHETDSARFQPDKVLVDVATLGRLPSGQWPSAKVILVDTGLNEDEIARLVFTHRLDGVISTDTGTDLFLTALQAIHADQVWLDHSKFKALLHNLPAPGSDRRLERFSRREQQILVLVAEGCTNREIALRLNVSEQTVKSHIGRIFRKANVSSRAQLAPLALKMRS